MEFTDYLIIKAIVLIVAAFLINLIYSAVTGKLLTQARNDKASAQKQDPQAD